MSKAKKPIASPDDEAYLKMLGKRIRELRLEAGYTSHESFAYAHDFPRTQYGRYERGHNITFLNLLKLVNAFGLTLEEFFSEGFE
ncbi:MAG: helix-turn-helix domain-containing protein [Bacteroidales bacterium]|nr:helix-turn-helix domain-containing protein [Bacteroidales bacterium]